MGIEDRDAWQLVLQEIREVRKSLDDFKESSSRERADLRAEISALKVRAGVMGALAGLLPSIIRDHLLK